MPIYPALRGIALILPRVEHGAGLLRRTSKYASLLRISVASYLGVFEHPEEKDFFSNPLNLRSAKFSVPTHKDTVLSPRGLPKM